MALFVLQLQRSIHIQPMCWCSARVVRMVNTNGADGILSSNILSDMLYLLSYSVWKEVLFKSYRAVIINKESISYLVRTPSLTTPLWSMTVGSDEEQGASPSFGGVRGGF